MALVYAFDHAHPEPPKDLKGLLGGKGANLAEMTSVLGLPVPPGFTITTEACRAYLADGWPDGLDDEVATALATVEERMGRGLGVGEDPLLVSVRSGAPFSMPGMMDTVLDLGLNDESVEAVAARTGDRRFAYDSYRRFVSMYARIVQDVDGEAFDRLLEEAKEGAGAATDSELDAEALEALCRRYRDLVADATGAPFPQAPADQLRGAIEAVFRSWGGARAVAYRRREHISDDLGTAVNVQAMVFGNRDERSGTGVAFTRDPSTGERVPFGDFLVNAQGEDVVAGIRNTEPLGSMASSFPEAHAELLGVLDRLEAHYRDMCDTEFTIEQGRLWMLQTRVGKRTGAAALRMAVEMTRPDDLGITREEALRRVSADHLDQILHPQFAGGSGTVLVKGLGASPGAAVGRAYLTPDACVDAVDRGEQVILVRNETSPEDVHGMQVAEGILTARGGLASHAAVVARGWGIPAVVGAEQVQIGTDGFSVGDVRVAEGDVISLDGTTGEVVLGERGLASADPPPEFDVLLGWADEVRAGRLAVRANADNAPDTAVAVGFGAEGIGLCRTEHMFLADDRLPIVRAMILATTPEAETEALERLRVAQRDDFAEILQALEGRPLTVRLLDPPLHEFLPSVEELRVTAAKRQLTAEEAALLEAAVAWHEENPMLGTRGVRLAALKPGLYEMQVRALLEAAVAEVAAGRPPRLEVMIPLTVDRRELAMARGWVESAIASVDGADGLDVSIGTMIETPRAALLAGELAEVADFFSFGTNDLTQMTYGFSRDDVEARLVPAYLEAGILARNPFEVLDAAGVGELVALGVARGRATRADLKIGICGEHGGDPESIATLQRAGVDYVSCSPYRVPIARLAAAQALLA
ncbi:MAG TPA: pyruvate, phosphate dikinase [Acidimicrobiales bacterium]|nr:pyruvate, phosphate dikinase [Acidimicrobiales bacterium]